MRKKFELGKTPTKKKGKIKLEAVSNRGIPASTLLRAEAARLEVIRHAMPDSVQNLIKHEVWAFEMAAAYLDALNAPEKLERYVPLDE